MKLLVTKEGKAAFAVGIVLILSVLFVNRNPANKKRELIITISYQLCDTI